MNTRFLDFEQPIAELQAKIEELRMVGSDSNLNLSEEIHRLEEKSRHLTASVFSSLTSWQKTQLARHPLRPRTLDYINGIFSEFDEMFGDRHISAGHAIVGGTARFYGTPVMVIGHQKGNNTKENIKRNFGMPQPEDYQKALRLMKLAERFNLPIFTMIDTAGAYPGIEAEERNQSEAIARNLYEMSDLNVPIISTVIGEGGSGGALALSVADRLLMLQYSTYSVISPEGCASILWRSADKAPEAAHALKVDAESIAKLGTVIDQVIPEPLGGAHRDIAETMAILSNVWQAELNHLQLISIDDLKQQRYQKLMKIGSVVK